MRLDHWKSSWPSSVEKYSLEMQGTGVRKQSIAETVGTLLSSMLDVSLTCEYNVQGSSLAHSSLNKQRCLVRMNKLVDQIFLCSSTELRIALRNDMERKRPISILDRCRLGGNIQDLFNDTISNLCVTLTCDSLMQNRGGDMVIHDHTRHRNQMVASNTIENRIPSILAAHGEDSVHFCSAWFADDGKRRFHCKKNLCVFCGCWIAGGLFERYR